MNEASSARTFHSNICILPKISSRNTLQKIVLSRLSHIEDIIQESDYQILYFLLQQLYPSLYKLYNNQQNNLMASFNKLLLMSDNITDISLWIDQELSIEFSEKNIQILKNYVKICSNHKDFTFDDYQFLIPPPISEYPSWCKRLRFLQSLPPRRITKEKSDSLLKTSRLTPRSCRVPSYPPPSSTQNIPIIPDPSPLTNTKTSSLPTLPSNQTSSKLTPIPPLKMTSTPSQIRLLSLENKKIRQEVWKVLGIT